MFTDVLIVVSRPGEEASKKKLGFDLLCRSVSERSFAFPGKVGALRDSTFCVFSFSCRRSAIDEEDVIATKNHRNNLNHVNGKPGRKESERNA